MPKGQTMPPPMPRRVVRNNGGWKQLFLRGNTSRPLTLRQDRTLPNWILGASVAVFFVAMFACWVVYGYVPDMDLIIPAVISVLLFFYGCSSFTKNWCNVNEKQFLRNIMIVGFSVRLLWVLYMYFFFNPAHFQNTYGASADVDWYMPFGEAIAGWIKGDRGGRTFAQLTEFWDSDIGDVGYPVWLAILNILTFGGSDVFVPFVVKCIIGAYCGVCIYHVAKRRFGEGTARMAALFVVLNPNMIYWCGTMMKEAEMVFLCCLCVDQMDKAFRTASRNFSRISNFLFPRGISHCAVFGNVCAYRDGIQSCYEYGKKSNCRSFSRSCAYGWHG